MVPAGQALPVPALHRGAADGAGARARRGAALAGGPAPRAGRAAAGRVPALARLPHAQAHPARPVAAAQGQDQRRQRAAPPPPRLGAGARLGRGLPRRLRVQRQGRSVTRPTTS